MSLRCELVEGAAPFAELGPEWRALAERSGGTPFVRWEWLFPWWSQLAHRTRPVVLTARDESGALRGLLPFAESGGTGLRPLTWALMGEGPVGSDGAGPLLEKGWEDTAGNALSVELCRQASRWETLRLGGVPSASPWLASLRERLRDGGLSCEQRRGDVCPVIDLAGDPFAAIRRRESFERRRRWFERQPSFDLSCAAAPDEVGPALSEFLRLHDLRWRNASDAIPSPAIARFHREAAPRLAAAGLCRFYLLWLHGRPVAALYALVDRGAFYYYLPAFDPAWAHRSAGTVLLGLLVEEAKAEGFRRFELLRGTEPYKLDWSDRRWNTCTLHVRTPGAAEKAWETVNAALRRSRAVATALLPEVVVDRWRETLSRLSLRAAS